jgi:hypothetical protein
VIEPYHTSAITAQGRSWLLGAGVRDGGGTKMGRGRTCRIWPHDTRYVWPTYLNRISTYVALIFTKPKYLPASKQNQDGSPHYLSSVLSSPTAESELDSASHCIARCVAIVLPIFGRFCRELSIDSSKGFLRGVFPLVFVIFRRKAGLGWCWCLWALIIA